MQMVEAEEEAKDPASFKQEARVLGPQAASFTWPLGRCTVWTNMPRVSTHMQ